MMALIFSRILLAYDDSPEARLALDYACALARDGAQLIVAHAAAENAALVSAVTPYGFTEIDSQPLGAELEEQSSTILERALEACTKAGVSAEGVFLGASPMQSITELARARDTQLTVVGTHGRSGVVRTVLGSVAEEILRKSEVPVLLVNGHARSPRVDGVFARALVALDDTQTANAAMAIASKLAAGMATHLTLCNVIDSRELLARSVTYGYDPIPFQAGMHVASQRLLRELADRNGHVATAEDLLHVEGEPAETLERMAMQHNCQVIVLGTHARSGLKRLVIGSVAESLARTSSLPVLVVPIGKHGATSADDAATKATTYA